MSKDKLERAEASSLIAPEMEPAAMEASREAGADRLYRRKAREWKPSAMTVDRYLRRAGVNERIGALARSMYGTKIMSFEEWGATIATLLKRRVR